MALPPPTGIKTFLICDIRGYTAYTTEHGDEAAARLAAQFAENVEAIVEALDGKLLELRGDEAMLVFNSARQAIRAGVALQVRFAELATSDAFPLPVGVGIDAGEAVAVRGGFRGAALNVAARLCSLAAAGEVLATPEVVHLASRVDGTRYLPYGTVRLKGLTGDVEVIKIEPEGTASGAAAALRRHRSSPRTGTLRRATRRRRHAVALGVVAVLAALLVLDLMNIGRSGNPPTPDTVEAPLKATLYFQPDFVPKAPAPYMIPSGKPPPLPDDLRAAPAITSYGSPEYTKWHLDHGGVPYRSQTVRLSLAGTGETPVQITQLRAYIISREPARRGWMFSVDGGGRGSVRFAEVDLDCPQQPATLVTIVGDPPDDRVHHSRQLDLEVSETDVENLEVTAYTSSSYVRWGLEVRYVVVGAAAPAWFRMPNDPRMQVTGATPGSIRTYTYVDRQWAAEAGIKSGLVRTPEDDPGSYPESRRPCR